MIFRRDASRVKLTTRKPQPDDANDRFQNDPQMNLRAPTIAFIEDNRDLRDLEFSSLPDAISGFHLEQISDGEYSVQTDPLQRAAPPALEAACEIGIRHAGNQAGVSAGGFAKKQSLEIPIDHVDAGDDYSCTADGDDRGACNETRAGDLD